MKPFQLGVTQVIIVAFLLSPMACGGNSATGPTNPVVREGSVGGVVIERSAQGDQPVPETTFLAWVEAQNTQRQAVTDAQGRYQFSALPAGSRVWLDVIHARLYPWSQCALVVVAIDGHLNFDVVVSRGFSGVSTPDPPGSRSISGVVYKLTPTGRRAIAGIVVDFALTLSGGGISGTRWVHAATTDADGRFRLCGLPEAVGGVVIVPDTNVQRPVSPGPSVSIELEVP